MTGPLALPLLAVDAERTAGPFGLLLVLLIGVATVLLIRNMDRRVKRLPREFPPDGRGQDDRRQDGPPESGSAP